MLPSFVTMVPLFIVWSKLGLVNTFWPLILPAWFGNPFYIFLMRQFMMSLPIELEDAAVIDGAGHLRTFWSIILPQVKPALAVIVISAFMNVWNDFIYPLIYLSKPGNYTVALGLSGFLDAYSSRWDLLMAASCATILPVVIVFFLFQRQFVEGVTLTGIKG
jgi:multiple sugar transport system permease protein